ncbi:MAG: DUF2970 domain-containing protein [Pseudomonadota bacterium]
MPCDEDAAEHPSQEPQSEPLSLRQMIGSTLAAAVGVQSSSNRERDFSRGRATHFIALGVIGTALFVLLMIGIVRLVLA